MSNTTTISTATQYELAVDTLAQLILTRLRDNHVLPNPAVEVFRTMTGLGVRLHNTGVRPTVYSIEVKRHLGNTIGNIIVDTIVRENDTHYSVKQTFGVGTLDELISFVNNLAKQDCTGTPEETAENFEPLGLLYRRKASDYDDNRFNTTPLVLNVMARCAQHTGQNIQDNTVANTLYHICADLESFPEDEGFGSSDHYPYIKAAEAAFAKQA